MDPSRFDSLARSLAAPKTRRGLLGALAALGAGLLGARATDAQVTQAQCGNRVCAGDPGVCSATGCVCCVYSNGNSRCVPPGRCSGTVASPTTTAAPCAGACPASQDACVGSCCGGSSSCSCVATTEGTFCASVAGGASRCQSCASDADCVFGGGGVCRTVVGPGCGCGSTTPANRACLTPCPGS